MSFLLRQLCIALVVVVVVINCSQLSGRVWEDGIDEDKDSLMPRLRSGRPLSPDSESVPEEEDELLDEADKRSPYLKIGKRDNQSLFRAGRAASGDQTFLRIGRAPSDSTFLRIGRSPFLRVRRKPFLRIGRAPFLRIGRSQLSETPRQTMDRRSNDKTFLRIGRASGKTFLRIGRAPTRQNFLRIGRGAQSFLRIGRANEMLNEGAMEAAIDERDGALNDGVEIDTTGTMGKRGLRIGKRFIGAFSQGNSNDLTPEELQLLKENKDLLLEYMESHPEIFDDEQNENDDAYFAFPRQGRAMSFYFPRMGRSGDDALSSPYCCEEGVRKVFKIGKGTQELCANERPCCPGFEEQEKVYKDIIITECAEKSGSDKFRNFIGDE